MTAKRRPSRRFSFVVAIGVFLAADVAAQSEVTKADPDDPALVERGNAIYAQHCAACHGANLEGQPNWQKPLPNGHWPAPPHDRTGHTWHHPDKVLFDVTKYGIQAIVRIGRKARDVAHTKDVLSDGDISTGMISFIESIWPTEIQKLWQRPMITGNASNRSPTVSAKISFSTKSGQSGMANRTHRRARH